MNTLIAITEHQWSSPEYPLCELSIPVSEIASSLGIPLHFWSEDGLGPASGFMCRLPSGLVLFVQEFEHARERLGSKGPTVLVEATDLVALGVVAATNEVLAAFGLATHQVSWQQSEAGTQAARQALAAHTELRQAHNDA
jgi:hypothetical protein